MALKCIKHREDDDWMVAGVMHYGWTLCCELDKPHCCWWAKGRNSTGQSVFDSPLCFDSVCRGCSVDDLLGDCCCKRVVLTVVSAGNGLIFNGYVELRGVLILSCCNERSESVSKLVKVDGLGCLLAQLWLKMWCLWLYVCWAWNCLFVPFCNTVLH